MSHSFTYSLLWLLKLRVWFPHTIAVRSHRSKAAATMFAEGSELWALSTFCPTRAAATGFPRSEMSLFESQVQVTFSEMGLQISQFKRKESLKTCCKPALVHPLPPSVRLYVSLQSCTALPYNQRGNEKVGLAISSSVRSKAYHTAPLLTLRLTSQVLSKSWISDISTTKYL